MQKYVPTPKRIFTLFLVIFFLLTVFHLHFSVFNFSKNLRNFITAKIFHDLIASVPAFILLCFGLGISPSSCFFAITAYRRNEILERLRAIKVT